MKSGDAYGPEWSASLRDGSADELRGWVDLALAICDETDVVALRHFRRDMVMNQKPDRSWVTEADRAAEQVIRERISAAHPDHGLVGEEYGTEAGSADVRWYIDPIDGTHNFMRGVPHFATLIAVERAGELQAAVISAPALGERWYGWRGGGAWSVGAPGTAAPRRLQVSAVAELADAQVVYGSARDLLASPLVPGFTRWLDAAWRDRGFGDFWGYTLVAEGAAEAMVEVGLSPWDIAAPMLIVEEAGGRVTDVEGRRSLEGPGFVTSNGLIHEATLDHLRG
ncbi:MAG: inositol monophosphatase family protein [Chloroflexota bacterium]